MSVWYCIPSKRSPAEGTLQAWRDMGYKIIVAREEADGETIADKHYWVDRYLGWARSVNLLVQIAMELDPTAQWFVTGGDDYLPDPNISPDEIAKECSWHFHNVSGCQGPWTDCLARATFGVMQPTGDRWGEGRCTSCDGAGYHVYGGMIGALRTPGSTCPDCNGSGRSAIIDRICGSPWIGREFARRVNGGTGPLNENYFHNFADEELQHVARKLGVLWQRRDLTQTHRHWARPRGDWNDAPPWAREINHPQLSDWERSKALFAERKAAGFPGHEVIAG